MYHNKKKKLSWKAAHFSKYAGVVFNLIYYSDYQVYSMICAMLIVKPLVDFILEICPDDL